MVRILRLTPLMWLLSMSDALAECETRIEPMPSAQTKGDAHSPIRESEFRSVVLNPPSGTELRADTVLAVDFEYRIADFSTGHFRVLPLFKTGYTSSNTFDPEGRKADIELDSATGRAHLCLPLAHLYAKHALEVTWPLELQLIILKGDVSGGGRSVAMSPLFKLNSVDVPAAALERQAKAPPPQVQAALESAFNNFATRSALYKVCLQRFPALQDRLTPAYRAWETRNKADIDWVSSLKFEVLKEESRDGARGAMMAIDHMDAATRAFYDSWTSAQLTPQCEDIIVQASAKEVDLPLARSLAELRKWRPQQ